MGKTPDWGRVHGGFAYVPYERGENSGPPGPPGKQAEEDNANSPPAEIAIIDLKSLKLVRSVKSGHETEGVEFSPDGKLLLVTNEGDDTVSWYRVGTGPPRRTANLAT